MEEAETRAAKLVMRRHRALPREPWQAQALGNAGRSVRQGVGLVERVDRPRRFHYSRFS